MEESEHPIMYSQMKVRNSDRYIDITHEWDKGKYKTFTNSIRYGNRLEIVFDIDRNYYVVKNLDKIKKEWNTAHGISNDPLDIFLASKAIDDDL